MSDPRTRALTASRAHPSFGTIVRLSPSPKNRRSLNEPSVAFDRPQDEDPRFAQIMRVKNPKQRLRKFTDACKTRTVCPSSGTPQPQYRLEGMKITAEFKQRGEEDQLPEGGERKQIVTAERAYEILTVSYTHLTLPTKA